MSHGVFISAAHKSSGKTMVSLGICATLRACGMRVQPFKKGPDYIDPMWLGEASATACRNLDPYVTSEQQIRASFRRHAAGAHLALVEGNKGLFDGLALDGSNSNAALAKMLGLPVVLVLDARGMTRGIAPLILGYQAFDRDVRISGVILNHLGGSRHEAKLRAVIGHYTDVPVVGAIQHDPRMAVAERHLGLLPQSELADAGETIARIAALVSAQIDWAAFSRALVPLPARPAASVADPAVAKSAIFSGRCETQRIGVIRDRAFGFYYAEDLEALELAGAQLVMIDALSDSQLPELDGLVIGGGFPEMFMERLEANVSLRRDIARHIEAGLPVYAECGGLMYLCRSIVWKGRRSEMVGALGADVVMHDRPVGRGYVHLSETADHPWPLPPSPGRQESRAHEFHYSSLENLSPSLRFAYQVRRGHGIDGQHDGLVHRNLLASYSHLRSIDQDGWARRFMSFVRHTAFRGAAAIELPPVSCARQTASALTSAFLPPVMENHHVSAEF